MATPAKNSKKSDLVFQYPKRIERLAQEAAVDALEEARALGLSLTYILDGLLVCEGPEGVIAKVNETRYPR